MKLKENTWYKWENKYQNCRYIELCKIKKIIKSGRDKGHILYTQIKYYEYINGEIELEVYTTKEADKAFCDIYFGYFKICSDIQELMFYILHKYYYKHFGFKIYSNEIPLTPDDCIPHLKNNS